MGVDEINWKAPLYVRTVEVMQQRRQGRTELSETTRALRSLLNVMRKREVCAPPGAVARLEGAVIALEAVSIGRLPDADDLLVPGPYTV